jgi:predicted amidophosphoribosyltransferase
MPVCHRCRAAQVSDESDLCPSCVDELFSEAAEQQENERVTIRDYSGDQYLADAWLEDGVPFDDVRKIVEDPSYIVRIIELGELASVLADKYATAALRNLLLDRNPHILQALARYARRRRVRGRAGRKPRGPEADYVTVYNLRKSGLTFGQIAKRLWGTPSKRNLASAHFQRALKKGYPPIDSSSK